MGREDDDARLSAKGRKVAPKKSSRRVKKADNGGPAVEVQVYVQTHEEGAKSKMELAVEGDAR